MVEVAGEIDMGGLCPSCVPPSRKPWVRWMALWALWCWNLARFRSWTFMECLGLGFLIEQKKRLLENGGELRLVLGEGAATLLGLVELEEEFAIYPDIESARC